ncbi:DeoR/GlpR family DNA-binding transcription regulator [Mobilicoccus massiliensis]|uniref:DeoR/GlpR family DNA-binding transcription regulator n=1 Tax=Mobilicoccus massiliensis TaxID=1522310 RepID=UPI00058CF4AB|nr:DeoR/GlpR family DNA-binding transcription regulator [Mobilicoccus massiliensis]
MHQHERHTFIVDLARRTTRVEVADLADSLAVTPETIRRDLTVLERHGLVRRVHGGAIAIERLGFEPTLETRAQHHQAEKERIARLAVDLVPEHGVVLLDAGTTTAAVAELLPQGRELTVVTDSITIAGILARRTDIDLHLLGGRVRPRTLAAVGPWAVDALADVHIDVAFIGTNGLTVARGLTTPEESEAMTKRAMIAATTRVVVVCDHSKIGTNHFHRFCELGSIDTIVTDSGLDTETVTELANRGPEVLLA